MFIRGSGSGDSDAAKLTFDCCVNLEEKNISMNNPAAYADIPAQALLDGRARGRVVGHIA